MKLLRSVAHHALKKSSNNYFSCLGMLWSILHQLANTWSFPFFIIFFFFHERLANALKESRCVQIHAIVFPLLELRLCKIHRALF